MPRYVSCAESCSLIKQVCAAGSGVKRDGGAQARRGIIGIREKIDDIRPRDLTQFFRHPLSTKFIGEIKPPRLPFILSLLVNEGRRSAGGCSERTIEAEGQCGTDLMRENLVWLTFECLRPRPLDVLLRDTLTVSFHVVCRSISILV